MIKIISTEKSWIEGVAIQQLEVVNSLSDIIKQIPMQEVESFSMKDVKIESMRSSGAGGQHVNKTESAVRATHVPSKTVIVISDQRSQHQNKAIAIAILMNKIKELNVQKQEVLERQNWQNHNELIRGNPVRKFTE